MSAPNPQKAWLDAALADDSGLSSNERHAAMVYERYASDVECVWVARAEFKRRSGMSSDKAAAAIHGLEVKGWLTVILAGAGTRATRYRLSDPTIGSLGEAIYPSSDPTSGPQGPRASDPVSGSSDPVSGSSDPTSGPDSLTPLTHPPAPRRAPDAEKLAASLALEGVGDDDVDRLIQISRSMGSHSPVGRLLAAPSHRRECVDALRTEQRTARRAALDTAPKCHECQQPVSVCDSAAAKTAPEDACRGFEDRRAAA